MGNTVPYEETIIERCKRDPEARKEMLKGAFESLREGDFRVALDMLGYWIKSAPSRRKQLGKMEPR